jgi:hypothetical protein
MHALNYESRLYGDSERKAVLDYSNTAPRGFKSLSGQVCMRCRLKREGRWTLAQDVTLGGGVNIWKGEIKYKYLFTVRHERNSFLFRFREALVPLVSNVGSFDNLHGATFDGLPLLCKVVFISHLIYQLIAFIITVIINFRFS